MDARSDVVEKIKTRICVLLIAAPYFLVIFTYWGNPFHGPGPWSAMVMDGTFVLGAYSAVELFRGTRKLSIKIVTCLLGVPLIAAVAFRLYWATKNYYWPWIFA